MNKTGEPQLRPRGPKPGLIGGNALEFRENMVAFYQRNQREYGDVAFYRLLNLPFYQLSHPADIKEVLLTQAHKVQKSPIYKQMLSKYLGNGLLISDGEIWKRQRKRTQPAFHHVRIHAYADTMVESTAQAIADWQERGAVDIYDEMTRLTLQIVVQTLFHVDVREQATEIGELTRVLQEAVIGEVSTPLRLPDWVPTPALRRKRHSIQRLDEIVYGIINERLRTGEDRGDLLSMMLLAADEEGKRMTPQEARDEALTIFIAGHDTTANALTWTWVLLSQHPAVGAKLDAELDRVLGDRLPTLEDLPALTYTEMVIKEAMRLYPPAFVVARQALEPIALPGGYVVPAGMGISIPIYVVHHDVRWFPNPEQFDPERFHPERKEQIPRYAYLPFLYGPRQCIGNGFAMMEAQLILATIRQRVQLRLQAGQEIRTDPLITLSPAGSVMMDVNSVH